MAKHDNKKTTYHCPCDLRQAKTHNFLSKSRYDRTALFNAKYPKMLSFSLVAEALAGLIYHRPSGEISLFSLLARPHWPPSRHRTDNRGPQCLSLGKRDWARPHNQVGIVHRSVEPLLHFASPKSSHG